MSSEGGAVSPGGGVVLGIDTAGPVVGVALWTPLGVETWSQAIVRQADSVLLPAIGRLLAGAPGVLTCVAVSVGPGAFTGLRVGVSAALGVAFARSVPVVPISSLEARAAAAGGPRTLALLDARKGKVYAGLFDVSDSRAAPVLLSPEVDDTLAAVLSALGERPFLAVGEGATSVDVTRAILDAGGSVSPDAGRSPADAVARLGALRWAADAGAALDPADVALRYLRAPDARPPLDVGQQIGRRGR